MAKLCLIIGESGTGKSFSIRTLNPEETFLISVCAKNLSFKGGDKKYINIDKNNHNGNKIITDDYAIIDKLLDNVVEKNIKLKTLIIDDFQYLMINEFMRRHSTSGKGNSVYSLYNEIADHMWNLINKLQFLRNELIVICLSHSIRDENGYTKCKTIGKLLEEKLGGVEGLFTIVLDAAIDNKRYVFRTQNNGMNTSKSPYKMFESEEIENSLQLVVDAINNYYN